MNSLRQDFDFIHWIMNESELNLPLATRLDITKNTKRKIRKILSCDDPNHKYHYRDEMGESFWFKEFFNTTFSEEEKENLFKSYKDIYSPIASMLGLSRIKDMMEDAISGIESTVSVTSRRA